MFACNAESPRNYQSEEDIQLKNELDMLVERLKVPQHITFDDIND
jgi:hypothetical protein